ncbi:rhodanese-related sulfurtransferase [Boudabousia marimammalium]|uniref:tRNA uridine(34) hydroxylase n=1 Tax=Boudabousia marimammalium TaxID=156892 RepID=A0A1Q5PM06_9ACTO|nr:rhodanese-related sulfurtransferase [Boudabousia marimammalium]OKL48076.1 hypothetical protein BM477_06330 [Boudabousia marimammalium]
MSESRILLYYYFVPLADPQAIMLWQRTLCEKLGLTGRIIISEHGINGTVGGELSACKQYMRQTRSYPGFKGMEFKISQGGAEDFPRLSVKVRKEIVTFGVPEEIKVDNGGVVGGGVHLKPEQLHELMDENNGDIVFFDGRNAMEAKIGHFKNAVVPNTETTRDFIAEIESGAYDDLKDKPIVTYCTGGIRCEILTALMKNRGFKQVYQMDGGIVRYGEKYGNQGLWEGSLYVFDRRMHMEFGPDVKVLGQCVHCGEGTHKFYNCGNNDCRELILLCPECHANPSTNNCGKSECVKITSAINA